MRRLRPSRALLLGLSGAVLLTACDSGGSAGPEEGVGVEDIQAAEADVYPYFDPEPLLGDEVTVSGEVSAVLGESAFRLGGDEFGDEGLPVVSAESVTLEEGAVAQVTGTVTESDLTAINDELGTELTEDDLGELGREYVISASSVDVLVPAVEGDAGPVGGDAEAIPSQLEQAGDFGILLSALSTAGLTDTLLEGGPYTVFAPTDEAFEAIPEAQLTELLADPQRLGDILRSHVVEGQYTVEDLIGTDTLTTLQGETLDVTTQGDDVLVNGVQVIEQFDAENGIIQGISGVLMPAS